MKRIIKFQTRDGVEHRDEKTAESHCLQTAHVELTEWLRALDIDSAYLVAQRIIHDTQKDVGAAKLALIVAWLADAKPDDGDGEYEEDIDLDE